MGKLAKVEIKNENADICGTHIFVDGVEIHRVAGIEFSQYVDECPQVTLKINALMNSITDKVDLTIGNKYEIAQCMSEIEFKDFCRIWHEINNKMDGMKEVEFNPFEISKMDKEILDILLKYGCGDTRLGYSSYFSRYSCEETFSITLQEFSEKCIVKDY